MPVLPPLSMDPLIASSEECSLGPQEVVEFGLDALGLTAAHGFMCLWRKYSHLRRTWGNDQSISQAPQPKPRVCCSGGKHLTGSHHVPILLVQLVQVQMISRGPVLPYLPDLGVPSPRRTGEPGLVEAVEECTVNQDTRQDADDVAVACCHETGSYPANGTRPVKQRSAEQNTTERSHI